MTKKKYPTFKNFKEAVKYGEKNYFLPIVKWNKNTQKWFVYDNYDEKIKKKNG